MQDIIQTQNLGSVLISKHVIRYFIKAQADGDEAIAIKKAIEILQSQEIDKLVTPIPSQGLEFWVHRSSSLVFTALLKDGYKLISVIAKHDMSGIVFDEV